MIENKFQSAHSERAVLSVFVQSVWVKTAEFQAKISVELFDDSNDYK